MSTRPAPGTAPAAGPLPPASVGTVPAQVAAGEPAPELLELPEGDGQDPARVLRRRIGFWAGALAPAGFVLSNVLLPSLPSKTAQVVPKLPPVIDRLLAVHLVYALASLLFLPFVVGLWRISARRGGVLRLVGGLLLVVGMVSNALGEVTDGYTAWNGVKVGIDQSTQIRLLDHLDSSSAALPISFLAIPVVIVGMLLLAVGVLRSRAVPSWAPWTLIGGLLLTAAPTGPASLLGLVFVVGATATVVFAERNAAAVTGRS